MNTQTTNSETQFEKLVDQLVFQQLEYFVRFTGRAETLIDACANVVCKGTQQLKGVKFPICLVVEALRSSQSVITAFNTTALQEELLEYLNKSYEASSFNYFDKPYLPNDLDTASALTRLLSYRNRGLVAAYEEFVNRNTISENIVPTWLDTPDYERWFVGPRPYHLDVLLNHWLTELGLGKRVNPSVVLCTVNTLGLQNYWYLPPLYTPYLYCRLLSQLGLNREEVFLAPLIRIVEKFEHDPPGYMQESNVAPFTKMKALVEEQSLSDNLNIILEQALRIFLAKQTNSFSFAAYEEAMTGLFEQGWHTPLYWSLGFTAFSSEPVNRAVALSCLLETKMIGVHDDHIIRA